MAKGRKTATRQELRRQHEAAEAMETAGEAKPKAKRAAKSEVEVEGEPKPKKAAAKKPASRSKKKKVEIVRLRRMWGVFDNNNQQVAVFPYAEKAAAEQKRTELNEKGKSVFFMQPVNEPIPEVKPPPDPEAIAKAEAKAARAAAKAPAKKK